MIVKIFLNKQAIGKYCEAKENFVENWMGNNYCQFDTNNTNNERLSYLQKISEKIYKNKRLEQRLYITLDQFSF